MDKIVKLFVRLFVALLIISIAGLGVLAFGNPQWHKWIYVFQVYVINKRGGEYQYVISTTDYHCPISKKHLCRFLIQPENYSGEWKDWCEQGHLLIEEIYVGGHIAFRIDHRSGNPRVTWDRRKEFNIPIEEGTGAKK